MGMTNLPSSKISPQSINLAIDAANEELLNDKSTTLKKIYANLMDQLEIDGYVKNQISIIGQRIIIEKKQNILKSKGLNTDELKKVGIGSWWFEVAHDKQCIDSFYSRNTKVDPQPDQKIVPLNNHNMKILCYDIIHVCKILIDKSKYCKSFEDTFGEKQMREFYKQTYAMINNCKDAIDKKTKVPRNTEIFLLEYLSTVLGNVNKCAELFMKNNLLRLKEQGVFLTTKQASKFLNGGKQSKQFILKPIDRDTAIYERYTGIQCTCGGWRVRPTQNLNGLECFDCNKITTGVYIAKCTNCSTLLYKKRLLHIVKTGKCKNCSEPVDLPPILIEYAKS